MKKLLCVFTALLLLASSTAFAESTEESIYPEGYDILLITDIFTNEDDELYAEKTEEELKNAPASLSVQGALGAAAADAESKVVGFDKNDIYTFGVADGCVILLPEDPLDPTNIVQIDDLQAWYDHANEIMADYFDEGQSTYEFYVTFELDDMDCFTKLEYRYFDWQ